jgi:hypothetical protein
VTASAKKRDGGISSFILHHTSNQNASNETSNNDVLGLRFDHREWSRDEEILPSVV